MMRGGVSASVSSPSSFSSFLHKSQNSSLSFLKFNAKYSLSFHSQSPRPRFQPICCTSSPGSPNSGEGDSRTVLDAFFLGKALGEAVTERIESAVGEFLSTVGRVQAEQQKLVQEFQDDVLERAKIAKEKAAREALEEQGRLVPNTTIVNASGTNGGSPSDVSINQSSVTPESADNPDSLVSRVVRNDQDSPSSIPIDE